MQTITAILDQMLRWHAGDFEADAPINGADMVDAFAEWRTEIKAALAVRAMVLYQLDPGHSDLDNEQPMSVKVGGADYRCTLGDIREAQRQAYGERNAIADLIRDRTRTPIECAAEIMALCGLPLPPAVAQ